MIIDTHAHLDMKEFGPDRDEVIKRAVKAGVTKIITVGVYVESSKKAVELSQKYPEVYAAVGIQPEEVYKYFVESSCYHESIHDCKPSANINRELTTLARNKKVVAIGEIGLDYKFARNKVIGNKEIRSTEEVERGKQKEIFRRQLGLAVTLDLPVIVHCREAEEDVITEIVRYKDTKKLRGVIHCFTGTEPFARKVLECGFYISFSGIITFPSAKDLREVAKEVPLDRILAETDSPLIAPQSHRGERNEPVFVIEVVKEIAKIKGIDQQEVSKITTQNAKNLFRIN